MLLGVDSNTGILAGKIQRMFKGGMSPASPIPWQDQWRRLCCSSSFGSEQTKEGGSPRKGANRKELPLRWDIKSQALVIAWFNSFMQDLQCTEVCTRLRIEGPGQGKKTKVRTHHWQTHDKIITITDIPITSNRNQEEMRWTCQIFVCLLFICFYF